MNWFEALILGLVQGLTEFLPVSSSGHLELGSLLLKLDTGQNLTFAVVVHGATVLSIIIVFWKDIIELVKGLFQFKWNGETKYIAKIFISMIPVAIVGLFFEEEVKGFFSGNATLVGSMLIITALLLTFTHFVKVHDKNISFFHSFVIGIAQALAVLPGISRAGATIATGLILKNKKENVARFSFLMVLIPIIGANAKDIASGNMSTGGPESILPLAVGFLAAFISGLLACKWMINIVKNGKLYYFAIYCFIVGITAIICA